MRSWRVLWAGAGGMLSRGEFLYLRRAAILFMRRECAVGTAKGKGGCTSKPRIPPRPWPAAGAKLQRPLRPGGPVCRRDRGRSSLGSHPGPAYDWRDLFFRNRAQLDALRQHIFPEILARRASIQSLRIWSAGCATGEEPYSLAMMLRELLTEQEHWHATILATDINPPFLRALPRRCMASGHFAKCPSLRTRFFSKRANAAGSAAPSAAGHLHPPQSR